MTIPTRIAVGQHAHDGEIVDLQNAMTNLLTLFTGGATDAYLRSASSQPAFFSNPMLSATTVAGQSIASGSNITVVFGTVTRDTDSAYNNVSGVFTVPAGKGGDYLFMASTAYSGSFTGFATAGLLKNASVTNQGVLVNPAGAQQTAHVFAIVNCAAGDTLACVTFQNSGVNQTLTTAAGDVYLMIKRLG